MYIDMLYMALCVFVEKHKPIHSIDSLYEPSCTHTASQ